MRCLYLFFVHAAALMLAVPCSPAAEPAVAGEARPTLQDFSGEGTQTAYVYRNRGKIKDLLALISSSSLP